MVSKLFSFIFGFVAFFFFFPQVVSANANFTTDYQITYTIEEDGNTRAQIRGTITNTTSDQYASSYKMQLGFEEITNVKAADADGAIIPSVTKNEQGYVIGLEFNKRSVGVKNTLPFSITFDTPAIARNVGKIWEINIPGVSNPSDFTNFTVTVVVPPSFGQPMYIKPKQENNKLSFTKEQLGKSGISMAFGIEQLYDFDITYHLQNGNIYPAPTEIALPPTTNYQDVFITSIDPQPENVVRDADGNWLARYRLAPWQKLDVRVQGTTQVVLVPRPSFLSPNEYADYTKELPNWQTKSPEIKALADELKTPQAIYDYVVKTLTYDFSRVIEDQPRLGALDALKNPNSAVCREFTDLFIALARAANIPAREVDGYAYTENARQRPLSATQDILHTWPEYYDQNKRTWVMVDPTWGSTTGGVDYFDVFDFDHVAFVKKGLDSDYPLPAGGYKLLEGEIQKDVEVTFGTEFPDTTPNVEMITDFPDVSIAGLPIVGKITMKNVSSKELLPQELTIISSTLSPQSQVLGSDTIPPFGSQTWEVKFDPKPFLTKSSDSFTIQFAPGSELGDKTGEKTLTIAPFFLAPAGIGVVAGGIFAIIIFIVAFKFRSIRFSRQK